MNDQAESRARGRSCRRAPPPGARRRADRAKGKPGGRRGARAVGAKRRRRHSRARFSPLLFLRLFLRLRPSLARGRVWPLAGWLSRGAPETDLPRCRCAMDDTTGFLMSPSLARRGFARHASDRETRERGYGGGGGTGRRRGARQRRAKETEERREKKSEATAMSLTFFPIVAFSVSALLLVFLLSLPPAFAL